MIILNKINSEKSFKFKFQNELKSSEFTKGLIIFDYSKFLRFLTELENNKRLIKYVKKVEINYINFDGHEFTGIDLNNFNFNYEEISLNNNNRIKNHHEIIDNFLAEKFGKNNTITKTEVFNKWFIEKYLFQNIIDILSQLTNEESNNADWKLILLTLNKKITYHNELS